MEARFSLSMLCGRPPCSQSIGSHFARHTKLSQGHQLLTSQSHISAVMICTPWKNGHSSRFSSDIVRPNAYVTNFLMSRTQVFCLFVWVMDWYFIQQGLYEEMTQRIDSAVVSGKIPEDIKAKHKGFSEWNSETTPKNHQPILQVAFLSSKLKRDDLIMWRGRT